MHNLRTNTAGAQSVASAFLCRKSFIKWRKQSFFCFSSPSLSYLKLMSWKTFFSLAPLASSIGVKCFVDACCHCPLDGADSYRSQKVAPSGILKRFGCVINRPAPSPVRHRQNCLVRSSEFCLGRTSKCISRTTWSATKSCRWRNQCAAES